MESNRLQALKRYEILDMPPEGNFDRITLLASKVFNVPIAIVSLVDEDRIWFKSSQGLGDVNEIGKSPGLCASAILSDEVYLVEDARNDPRSLANPLVTGAFGLEFYAAAPLKTQDGHNLGTFCAIRLVRSSNALRRWKRKSKPPANYWASAAFRLAKNFSGGS